MTLRNWFRSLTRNRTSKQTPRRLALEALEDRTVPTAVAPPSGMVAWWTADNTGVDLVGGNHATLINGTNYAAGKVAQAFNFDGVNDRAQVADSESLKLTASMTIEGWVRADSLPVHSGVILFRGDDRGGLDPYSLSVQSSGILRFEVVSLNGAMSLSTPMPLGQLVHLAGTLDDASGGMRLYVNGVLMSQTTTTVRPFSDLDPASNPGIGIGNHGGYPTTPHNFPFDGLIDELSVYNRALTAGEIQGIHAAGSDGKIKSQNYFTADLPGVTEGPSGSTTPVTFTIRRVGSLTGQAVVNWATANNTATAGTDYVAASGQVVFGAGESQKTVVVIVNGDDTPEANETFNLVFSTPTPGYGVGGGRATILEDDVGVSVSDANATEGDSTYRFTDNFVAPDAYGLTAGRNIRVAADGNIYVASHDTDVVKVFEPGTGNFLRDLGTSGGELDGPWGMTFGPDGLLYVGGRYSGNVVRFNTATGAYDVLVTAAASGGLGTTRGLAFGPDGNLYVSSHVDGSPTTTDTVKRYNGATGEYLGDFVAAGSGGLANATGVKFGPDGNFYVLNGDNGSVLRYHGLTGSFIDAFVAPGTGGLNQPSALLFHTDGLLYVCSGNLQQILRYNALTGAFVDVFASGRPTHDIAFAASGEAYVSASTPTLQPGSAVAHYAPRSWAAFAVSLNIPSTSTVTVSYAAASGTATAGSDFTSVPGTLTFAPGQTTRTILVQTLEDALGESTETFTITLSNPVGAAVTDSLGVATILDNETKFYVVDDAASNRTYEYASGGLAGESYNLNSGNTAPRGAASTAAGTTVWVVDANKKVYVYNAGGALLGSWTAGGLNAQAQIEGIATNGTDIWLVDAKQDKVFKYTGAASRLSGSQNAASSFTLNSGNANPKDLVTNGTHLWVVNDSTTDKVFKYTVAGSLLGSWTIDAANASPTGITLDPSNPQHLWIVDNGTDRVYQYDNAVSRTSGRKTASTTFALAAGNTNPQGIADPPSPAETPVNKARSPHTGWGWIDLDRQETEYEEGGEPYGRKIRSRRG